MMAITHMAIGAVAGSVALKPSLSVLCLAALGSQLPDLDTSQSWIGSIFFPVSRWIEKRFPHRTITHSLIASCSLLVLSYSLSLVFPKELGSSWLALPLGHISACFADTFTKQGVQLFYPKSAWCVCGANPNRRLSTGSVNEYFVLAGAIALLLINVQLATSGGWMRATTQAIGLREGAIETYNQEAGKRQVWATIKGVWAADRSKVEGEYFVLGVEGGEFVLGDGKANYKTGQNIIVERLSANPKGSLSTMTRTLTFNDQEPLIQIQQLQAENPQAAIYLSGSIKIDFPEDIQLSIQPNTHQVITIAGEQATLSYCPIESALIFLNGQYATGSLTAKILNPKPF